MGVWIMAGVTFREAGRKKMLWMALAAGGAFLILFGTGLHFEAKDFALWRRAAFEMQSPLANAMRISPFSTLSVPSMAMVFYAGLYLAIASVVAIRRFSQRDL